jgi:DNA-binding XRE family transcriptional regulator
MHMVDENPVFTARKTLRLTQTEMARALDVNLSTIVRWEKGHMPISQLVVLACEQLVERQKSEAA